MTRGEHGRAYVLETVAVPSCLDEVHALFEDLWGDVPEVGPSDRMALETAVSEVAANIVEHAARGESVPMRLVLHAGRESVEARLEDSGRPFVEHEAVTPGGDDLPEHGRGLVLARALTHALAYERDGTTNRWYLLRRRAPST